MSLIAVALPIVAASLVAELVANGQWNLALAVGLVTGWAYLTGRAITNWDNGYKRGVSWVGLWIKDSQSRRDTGRENIMSLAFKSDRLTGLIFHLPDLSATC